MGLEFDVEQLAEEGRQAAAQRHEKYLALQDKSNQELVKASVPKPIADHLKSLGLDKPVLEYAFNFVSCLLATTHQKQRTWAVDQASRMSLADVKKPSLLAERTRILMDKHIIELVDSYHFSRYSTALDTANVYRIHPDLMALVINSDQTKTYKTLRDYGNSSSVKSKLNSKLDESFKSLPDGYEPLKRVILNLQRRPIRCDVLELRKYLRTLSQADQDRRAGTLHSLIDGPNHATYRLARSGRLQTTVYNLQGVPRKLRRFFYPQSDEYMFLDLDCKSQESYILAVKSQDKKLLDVVQNGDIYQDAATKLNNLLAGKLLLARDDAKPVVNAFNYGAGDKTLARGIFELADDEIPDDEQMDIAIRFRTFMACTFPVATQWVDDQAKQIEISGTASVESGITRSDIEPNDARTVGVNHLIQGVGAVILWKILLELDDELGDIGHVVVPMHDGLVLEIRRENQDNAIEISKGIMERISREVLDVVIPVEVKAGWRDKSDPESISNRFVPR